MLVSQTQTKCLTNLNNITSMLHLKQIQAQVTKTALDQTSFTIDKLIAFSAISGDLNYACSILTHVQSPTNFMWNTIIRGFSQSQEPEKALLWYSKMVNSDLSPDKYAFPSVLKACSKLFDLRRGQQVHSQIIKIGPLSDTYIDSSLIYLYTSCGELEKAKIVFDGMKFRTVVNWNVMISGCVKSGTFVREALDYFHKMRSFEVNFDEFSLVSVTSACAYMGVVSLGKWVHGLACKSGFYQVVPLGNALVDVYGRCGDLKDARKLFDEMGMRNLITWSTMIGVFAMHGCGKHAVDVFNEMIKDGIEPDELTITSILCACSHSGLLIEGKLLFDRMSRYYGISPKIQHYGCMVDLLGKSGRVKEAYGLITEMPIQPDGATWRSLICACISHGELELARLAVGRLRELDPDDQGDLVIGSNLFARLGRWDDVEKLRRGARKDPGLSSIEVGNMVHEFDSRNL